ncbi:MAG: SDR family oxidoreductase [Polaromonas sp.]|uniref:SDR family oxidoreductase n=1 Tax=Polaromonas sp. TaxID=1869339 RepID=UPI00272F18FE|nr:SDR family oxidoreductase [Polaromonas sp.]MDP2449310.1 SDR family oxidoreductase [Polaromonas sp.]MDP3245495.1 SDR family oxidoreductase [Polaromonas sp.]MDP3754673.1 SDR family oxidoreductase [Polaromonas sp.]MDP3829210.1 SDR family oxidoreductase [Polaromonas sp.]
MKPASPAPVVLVTGAARRLGREIALALAASGWRVAVHYRSSEEDAIKTVADCERLAGAAASFCCELEDETAVRGLLPQVVNHFGQVDAVVNNASTFEHDSAASFGFASLEKHMRSNTGAAIVLAQALHAHVLARQATDAVAGQTGRSAVINLLDQKLWNPNPDFFSYTLSKAALEAANTLLAMALAPQVRVVGVAPGLTLTSHLLSDEKFQALHKLSPLGRSSSAADVAATVRFALENASITGTTLLVDGGQHLLKFERDFSLM